ncbi:MAG: PilZ domain-containing protein [Pseudomonadota bacterium]
MMMSGILSLLGLEQRVPSAIPEHRRKYVRYPGYHAEVIVGDQSYSVRDWSRGGVAFETAPDARLTTGDHIQVTLKFRLPHDTITIRQLARIVRASRHNIAAEFAPLPTVVHRQFERVLDNLHAQDFLESQVV